MACMITDFGLPKDVSPALAVRSCYRKHQMASWTTPVNVTQKFAPTMHIRKRGSAGKHLSFREPQRAAVSIVMPSYKVGAWGLMMDSFEFKFRLASRPGWAYCNLVLGRIIKLFW
jgi:hypothetical protein